MTESPMSWTLEAVIRAETPPAETGWADFCPLPDGRWLIADEVGGRLLRGRPGAWDILGQGELSAPAGVLSDSQGRIWVADKGRNQVGVLDAPGAPWRWIGQYGNALGEFNEPTRLAELRNGQIAVLDRSNHRVQILSGEGAALGQTGRNGDNYHEMNYRLMRSFRNAYSRSRLPPSPPSWNFPEDLGLVDGRVSVLDQTNRKITRLEAGGRYHHNYLEDSPLRFPSALAWRAGEICVWIADHGRRGIWRLDPDDVPTWQDLPGQGDAFYSRAHWADGRLILLNEHLSTLEIFAPTAPKTVQKDIVPIPDPEPVARPDWTGALRNLESETRPLWQDELTLESFVPGCIRKGLLHLNRPMGALRKLQDQTRARIRALLGQRGLDAWRAQAADLAAAREASIRWAVWVRGHLAEHQLSMQKLNHHLATGNVGLEESFHLKRHLRIKSERFELGVNIWRLAVLFEETSARLLQTMERLERRSRPLLRYRGLIALHNYPVTPTQDDFHADGTAIALFGHWARNAGFRYTLEGHSPIRLPRPLEAAIEAPIIIRQPAPDQTYIARRGASNLWRYVTGESEVTTLDLADTASQNVPFQISVLECPAGAGPWAIDFQSRTFAHWTDPGTAATRRPLPESFPAQPMAATWAEGHFHFLSKDGIWSSADLREGTWLRWDPDFQLSGGPVSFCLVPAGFFILEMGQRLVTWIGQDGLVKGRQELAQGLTRGGFVKPLAIKAWNDRVLIADELVQAYQLFSTAG